VPIAFHLLGGDHNHIHCLSDPMHVQGNIAHQTALVRMIGRTTPSSHNSHSPVTRIDTWPCLRTDVLDNRAVILWVRGIDPGPGFLRRRRNKRLLSCHREKLTVRL
jgi:hypothetical protein